MSEPDLAAYLAGELEGDEARAVEARIARDPALRARAVALEKTFALLDYLPEPTPATDFAARTLGLVAASHEALTLPASRSLPGRKPRRLRPAALALIALALGVAAGAMSKRLAGGAPRAEPPGDVAADYRVSVRLPWYAGCDDLAFAEALAGPGLFAPDAHAPPPALLADPAGPADKLISLFQSLPPERRGQLRRLDAGFTALPDGERARVGRALDAYAGWLAALPDGGRARVFAAAPGERLRVVRDLRAAERRPDPRWRAAGAKFARLSGAGRVWPFTDAKLAAAVETYTREVLKCDLDARPDPAALGRLSREEFADLRSRRDLAGKDGGWGLYGLQIYRLAERHPYLPEPRGGVRVAERAALPPEFLREARKRHLLARIDFVGTRGRWPEFALEVAEEARKARLAVPEAFGPCRPAALAPEVRALLAQFTPAERDTLAKLEGRWPDYPRALVRTSAAHDLPVPGVTLPGSPAKWAGTYGPPP